MKKKIVNMIYEISGKQLMFDRDLAKLYQIETRVLNQRIKRNIGRFPDSFCWQMTEDEFLNWKSQIVMSSSDKIGLRRAPYVFTEQGVAMLSAIITTDIAIEVSIRIMNAFVEMKKYINNQVLKNLINHRFQMKYFLKVKNMMLIAIVFFDKIILTFLTMTFLLYKKRIDILSMSSI